MIKRIVVLLEVLSKMSDFYICWECSNRSYLVRYTVILITSSDCNHITWFRNSASVSLLATLSHKTWVANDFSSSQLSQKRSKNLKLHFLKIFLQTKIFFLTHLLYAKSTLNSDRELYKKTWCDQMRIWFSFHWKTDLLFWLSQMIVAKSVDKLSQIIVTRRFIEKITIRSLKRRETE
jgi:hypothetical protein